MEIRGGGQPSLRDSLLFAWAVPALRCAACRANYNRRSAAEWMGQDPGARDVREAAPGAESPFCWRLLFAGLPFDFAQDKKAHASTLSRFARCFMSGQRLVVILRAYVVAGLKRIVSDRKVTAPRMVAVKASAT